MENVVKEHVIQEKRTSKNWGLCTVFSAWIATARMYYEIQSLLVFTLSLIFFLSSHSHFLSLPTSTPSFSFIQLYLSFLSLPSAPSPSADSPSVANTNMAALSAGVAGKCLFARKWRGLVML